jgi:hypothetical protein
MMDFESCLRLRENDPLFDTWMNADIFDEDDATLFVYALEGNSHLRKLGLRIGVDRISGNGATAIMRCLSQSHVLELTLEQVYDNQAPRPPPSNSGYSQQTAHAIAHHLPNLTELRLLNIDMGNPFHTFRLPLDLCLSSWQWLRSLSLTTTQAINDSWRLQRGLSHTRSLRRLCLHDGIPLTKEAMRRTRELLDGNHSITALEFHRCKIKSDAVELFCGEQLPLRDTLDSLDFTDNFIRPVGALCLLNQIIDSDPANANLGVGERDFLLSSPTMRVLDLSLNPHIGYGCLEKVGNLLPRLPLRQLFLRRCGITETSTGTEEMFQQIAKKKRKAADALLEGIKKSIHLYYVDVSDNGFDAIDEAQIEFSAACNGFRPILDSNVPGLYCKLLGKYQRAKQCGSIIFHVIRETPHLFQEYSSHQVQEYSYMDLG